MVAHRVLNTLHLLNLLYPTLLQAVALGSLRIKERLLLSAMTRDVGVAEGVGGQSENRSQQNRPGPRQVTSRSHSGLGLIVHGKVFQHPFCQAVVDALCVNRSIKQISIADSDIGDAGGQAGQGACRTAVATASPDSISKPAGFLIYFCRTGR